jgi:isocitrate dehydrogenase
MQKRLLVGVLSSGLKQVRNAGTAITMGADGKLKVPHDPIIPFIEGDGTGPDIWKASQFAIDGAVQEAYGGRRKIHWVEVLAGEKAFLKTGEWLPQDTIDKYKQYLVGIKGPLTTPIGGGIRSLNVALRQILDLYVCLRPVRYYNGVPSPVNHPEDVDMVIFRENTEDIYAGIEFKAGTAPAKQLVDWLQKKQMGHRLKWPDTCSLGVKPVSKEGTYRLVNDAIKYALKFNRRSVTFVHKGNIMKHTEQAFCKWGYELAKTKYRKECVTEREATILGNYDSGVKDTLANAKLLEPGFDQMDSENQQTILAEVNETIDNLWARMGDGVWRTKLLVKDRMTDICLQQVLTRGREFDVMATLNLNGDYLSDALAAQVGGIGIAPGGNINYITGHAIFEATHGTAPKYANKDVVNPGSVILSGEMMLRHIGWHTAANLIIQAMDKTISQKTVTYDFHRLMDGATKVKCSEFGKMLVSNMVLDGEA